ncbi:MAG TPA: hypothetical protein PKA90_10000 [Ignavibacteria bacterium]|nr:hypothetical protein [Ignavibacteria bacterium]HMR40748.1 hypothetical protein [Ignavibacteria bacterium]
MKTFSGKEIKEFGEFISNSYFNKRKAVKQLYELIRKYYPEFSGKGMEKEYIFKKLFPGKKYNESSISVLFHFLHDLSRRFIAIKNFESNKLEYDLSLESELFKRKQSVNPWKILEKHLRSIDPSEHLSEEYYLLNHRLKYEAMFYNFQLNSGLYEKFLNKLDFQGIYMDFYYHFLIKSMRMYLNVLHTEKIYNKEYEKKHFEKLMLSILIEDYEDTPFIQIYYYLIKMLEDRDHEKYYFKVKELLKKIPLAINIQDQSEIYINMQNYCKRRLAEGKLQFLREEFDLLTRQLESKTYLVNGNIHSIFYRTAVTIALRLDEHKWVSEFIVNFKDDLQEQFRESTFLYCSAQLEFYRKNYDKASEMLSRLKLDEVYLKYESKILQMMVYYETGFVESLLSALEAYRQFLQNNNMLPGVKKKFYLNFYKFLNKLVNITRKKDKSEIIKVRNEIAGEMSVNSKDWLLKKADEILISVKERKN